MSSEKRPHSFIYWTHCIGTLSTAAQIKSSLILFEEKADISTARAVNWAAQTKVQMDKKY